MKTLVLWRVQGYLRDATASRHTSKRDFRNKLFAAHPDATAEDVMLVAGEVLLHNWSSKPHFAEVISVTRERGDEGISEDLMQVVVA